MTNKERQTRRISNAASSFRFFNTHMHTPADRRRDTRAEFYLSLGKIDSYVSAAIDNSPSEITSSCTCTRPRAISPDLYPPLRVLAIAFQFFPLIFSTSRPFPEFRIESRYDPPPSGIPVVFHAGSRSCITDTGSPIFYVITDLRNRDILP